MKTKRQTSIEAYKQIKDEGLLSQRRWQVYSMVFNHGPLTISQLTQFAFKKMGHTFNTGNFGTRLSELRRLGVVKELGTTCCPVTARNVILWDVTDKLPKKPAKDESKITAINQKIQKHKQAIRALERTKERIINKLASENQISLFNGETQY